MYNLFITLPLKLTELFVFQYVHYVNIYNDNKNHRNQNFISISIDFHTRCTNTHTKENIWYQMLQWIRKYNWKQLTCTTNKVSLSFLFVSSN